MGDALGSRRGGRWKHSKAAVIGLALVLSAACSSAPPAGQAPPSGEAPATAVDAAAPVVVAPAASPVEIEALALEEEGEGVRLSLTASAPVVWTSFRNADGQLVVELPNSVPAAAVTDLTPASGLLESVAVEVEDGSERPLTRLVVITRAESEHTLFAEGNRLQIELVPVPGAEVVAATPAAPGTDAMTSGAEPGSDRLAEPEAPAGEAMAADWSRMDAGETPVGTPDNPYVAPAPAGPAASRLVAVEARALDGGAVIQIAGDGAFPYSTFRLENPERFVLDLPGVVNAAPRTTVAVGSAMVDRVRVAQFKTAPDPVTRVVVDLSDAARPRVERTADGLTITFGSAAEVAMAPPAGIEPEIEPRAEPETPAEIEPEATELEVAEAPPPIPPAPATPISRVERAPAPLRQPAPTSDVELYEAAQIPTAPEGEDERVLETFQTQTLGTPERVYRGEPINMSLKDADIKDVLRSFAQISGLNVVVQPGVTGTVTVELTEVPWDQALEQILKINNLGYELEGNIMRIAPVEQLQREAQQRQQLEQAKALSIPLQTVMKRISYASADELSGLLRAGGGASILSPRGSVVVDARTNTVIIKELPGNMDTVLAVIENLDAPEPQVMIEARIVETSKTFSRTLGIAWELGGIADARHGNTTGLVFPNNVEATGGVSLLRGGANGLLDISLGNVLNTFTLDATLQAAENQGLINVLSAPKVATLNNQSAEIQSGLQIPIQTVANNTVSVQFVNATLRLSVTPHVTAEGTVLMDIEIQKREPRLDLAVVGATNAPIATKEARTRAIVRDGGTTVIGGIYEVSTTLGEDRVPGLANIPILGNLFRNKSRNEENEELLIFITPRVIKL